MAQQGSSVTLSADGNTAIVSGLQNYYNVYLLYTRTNGRWNVTHVFSAGIGSIASQNDVSLSADGNTVLIGKEVGVSGPVALYKRNNNIWTDGKTLNDSVGSTVALSADGKTAILGRQSRGGNYGGGGYTPRGLTIMKFINNTWQAQAVPDVPADSARYAVYQRPQIDEYGNDIPQEPQYYNAYTGKPGNLVAISADGKTAASVSFGLYGRYNYVFQIPYTVIYVLKPTGWAVETKILQDVRYIKLSADGNTFIAGGAVYQRTAGMWTKQEGVHGTALSADGNTVLAAGEHLIAFTRNGSTWTQREVPAETPPADVDQYSNTSCALSADGSTAFFGVPGDKTVPIYAANGDFDNYAGSVTAFGTTLYNPLDHATTITFSNTTDTSTTLSWPRGDGTTKRAVFLKMGTDGLPAVINGTAYVADSLFMSTGISKPTGSVAAKGWYCVYNGTGGYVNIKGLKTGTTYTASIVEYTGNTGSETYQVTGVTTRVTTSIVAPNYYTQISTAPGKIPATTRDIVSYSAFGPVPVGVAIFVKEIIKKDGVYPSDYNEIPLPGTTAYMANFKFGAGDQIHNSGWFCVYNGAYSTDRLIITGLQPGAYYRIAGVNYNGSKTEPVYTEPGYMMYSGETFKTAYLDPPSGYATALAFTNTTATSTTLSWTKGNGGLRAVFIGVKGNALPVPADFTTYKANAAIGSGTQLGTSGWYCVYNGAGSTVNISNLLAGTTYRAEVIEYNGDPGSERYLISRFAPLDVTTPKVSPTVQASGVTFAGTTGTSTTVSWTNGNGAGRAVFVSNSAIGAPLPAEIYYAGGPKFNNGTQIGNSGWYCIYNGTGTTANISQLINGQTYRVAVVEYNGTLAAPKYLTAAITPANFTTPIEAPTGYAVSLTFTNTAATSTTLSWLSSNGAARAVFMRLGTSGVLPAINGMTYQPGAFGAGTQVGNSGWYCIYNGTGNTVNITGLSAKTNYRAVVIEYNGSGANSVYNISRYNGANVATTAMPVVLSANLKPVMAAQDVLANEPAPAEVNIHQGMSPNADGINDVFTIDNITAYPDNTVKIMNTNGDVIYSATGYDNSSKVFDGHAANGTMQKAGTYFYALAYKKGAEVIRKTGYLVIKI
ncbi:hypothetical protein A0256_15990 [Mucilaginibacter sp. PAMC 26640]|nr:hypothetical protein A0256_15990 [Mucilaginibacter sp. PAMC 26640]